MTDREQAIEDPRVVEVAMILSKAYGGRAERSVENAAEIVSVVLSQQPSAQESIAPPTGQQRQLARAVLGGLNDVQLRAVCAVVAHEAGKEPQAEQGYSVMCECCERERPAEHQDWVIGYEGEDLCPECVASLRAEHELTSSPAASSTRKPAVR